MRKIFQSLLIVFFMVPAYATDNCVNLPAPAVLPSNGQEATPRMGWDGWYYNGVNLTEAQIKTQSDLLVSTGLKAAGYTYVEFDEWAGARTGGVLVPNVNYPSGIASLITYIHIDGLKAVTYSSPYTSTCASNPGSGTFESTDANSFASQGADGLMYDGCTVQSLYASCWAASGNLVFQLMAQDINTAGRPMAMILGTANIYNDAWATNFAGWAKNAGWNEQWIDGQNIALGAGASANWSIFDGYIDKAAGFSTYVGPGFWINFDFLLGPATALSATQRQTQFGLDALWTAPLLLGMDLSTLSGADISMYGNSEVIAVDQDALGKMATRFSQTACGSSTCEVWVKTLHDGTYAIGLLNRDSASHTVTVSFASFGTNPAVRDLWAKSNLGTRTSYAPTVAGYGMALIKVTPLGSFIQGALPAGAVVQ